MEIREIYITDYIETIMGPYTDPIRAKEEFPNVLNFPEKYPSGAFLAKEKGVSYDSYRIVVDRRK